LFTAGSSSAAGLGALLWTCCCCWRCAACRTDYGFEYSDEEPEEEDVDIENQYYNSKGKIKGSCSRSQAAASFAGGAGSAGLEALQALAVS
jgi:hypothetical protein